MWGVQVLPIVALAAVASYLARSRLTFLLSTAGAFVGLIIPQPKVYANYSSAEAAYMGYLTDSASHIALCGMMGAAVGWGVGLYLESARRRVKAKQRQLRGDACPRPPEDLERRPTGGAQNLQPQRGSSGPGDSDSKGPRSDSTGLAVEG